MSDTPTPETDAAWHSFTGNTEFAHNVKNLSHKLERERNEWAAMCGRYKQERDIAEADATNFHARIFELIDERDAAIEKHRLAVIHWQIGVFKMQRERDEARQQIAKLLNKLDQLYRDVEIDKLKEGVK